jgi:exopolysaccharide biosynthesis protein
MKLKRIILLLALVPLLLSGCKGKEPGNELPPPVIGGNDDDGGQDVGGGSGVDVAPLGKDWTGKAIDDGIIYYAFNGVDEISGKHQEAFAIDVDLNNPKYQVKLVYESPRLTTSAAFKKHNAIAAINANYEPTSIYMRINGNDVYTLQNEIINGTEVPNWKSEAAFSVTGDRGVKIFFVGSQKHGEMTVPEQRLYYQKLSATEYPNFISSAPMLVDNFKKVGENFCNYNLSSAEVNKLDSEDPDRHQRVLHPRTAVALTEKNHLILFVVDGRIQSAGMSARQLTRFLVKWFNPQYALNLDGGGSTTMCVKGEGDASTHVVNYPCSENKNYDHTGERSRDAFVMVCKKE